VQTVRHLHRVSVLLLALPQPVSLPGPPCPAPPLPFGPLQVPMITTINGAIATVESKGLKEAQVDMKALQTLYVTADEPQKAVAA